MKLYKTLQNILIEQGDKWYLLENTDWDQLINRDQLYHHLKNLISSLSPATNKEVLKQADLLPPIQGQEIWAAGVTYLRSKTARMEESEASGGAIFYDKVYDAERPELFFKAHARNTVGHLDKVNIRQDSTWDVPEPELTLFINASGNINGYTIGNDMSSRSIEGENPLYLPQAKCYDRSASIGPCLYVPEEPISPLTNIKMQINRDHKKVFEGEIQINQMKRGHQELAGFLFRHCSFPEGVYLMTGTCIVPDNDFTLHSKDEIIISIDHIGTLINYVA